MERIKGILVKGFGEGKFYINKYSDKFEDKLGYKPWSGTLNIKLNKMLKIVKKPLIIKSFEDSGKIFGSIKCYPCIINNKNIKAHLIMPEINKHEKTIIEIVSPLYLRKALNIQDNDNITIELI